MYRNVQECEEGQSTTATALPQQAHQRKPPSPRMGLSISKEINQGIPDFNVRLLTCQE